jgi:hypothetical protein
MHQIANALYCIVNRGIRVLSVSASAGRPGRRQRHGHRAVNYFALPAAFCAPQDDSGATDMRHVSRQHSEDTILGVRAGLRITNIICVDHLDAHAVPIGRKGRATRRGVDFPTARLSD